MTLVGDKDAAGTQAAIRVVDGKPLVDGVEGKPIRISSADTDTVKASSALRHAFQTVNDLLR